MNSTYPEIGNDKRIRFDFRCNIARNDEKHKSNDCEYSICKFHNVVIFLWVDSLKNHNASRHSVIVKLFYNSNIYLFAVISNNLQQFDIYSHSYAFFFGLDPNAELLH